MYSIINDSTKRMLLSQCSKKVSQVIGHWLQTKYPNIQRHCCPWCHKKNVELHRCHVGPRKSDIIKAEMEMLWQLSTAMGQVPDMSTFTQRIITRVKQDHEDNLTRIEIACGTCNPYFEYMQLAKLDELNQLHPSSRKAMWKLYKKQMDQPTPSKKRKVEPSIAQYFSTSKTSDSMSDSDDDTDDDKGEDEERQSKMKLLSERMQGYPYVAKCSSAFLERALQQQISGKYIHTKTLKEIYALLLGKPAMGHLANDRDWLRKKIKTHQVKSY